MQNDSVSGITKDCIHPLFDKNKSDIYIQGILDSYKLYHSNMWELVYYNLSLYL